MSDAACVEAALARGHEVVTLNRGTSGVATPDVDVRHADRLDDEAVARALGDDTFDAVVDTWSWAPTAVRGTARLLSGRAGHYTYVSSRSVYAWPPPSGADESAPVVDGDPDSADAVDYAAAKRGGELAAAEFDGPVALLRAGLILGPYEIVGRLPFWLRRIAARRPGARAGAVRPAAAARRRPRPGRLGARPPAGRHLQRGEPTGSHHHRRAARRVRPRHRLRRRAGLAPARRSSRPLGSRRGPSCRSGRRRPASSPRSTTATPRPPTTPACAAGRSP